MESNKYITSTLIKDNLIHDIYRCSENIKNSDYQIESKSYYKDLYEKLSKQYSMLLKDIGANKIYFNYQKQTNSNSLFQLLCKLKKKRDNFYDIEKAQKEFEKIISPSFSALTKHFQDIVLISKSAEAYREFLNAQKKFKAEEAKYQLVLLNLFQVVSDSSDYEDAFMFFDLIFRVGGQNGVDRIFQDEFFEFSKDKKQQLINKQEFIVYITDTIRFVLTGFCPKGRKCEDGTIDNKYPMVELDNNDYSYRTDKNAEFSDGVLIIQGHSTNDYGTQYTIDRAKELKKKLKIVNMFASNLDEVVKWIVNHNIHSLNVSGARKSNLLETDQIQVKIVCKKFLNNIHNEILHNNGFLVYDSIRRFYTLGPEGSFSYFTAQEIFQKMREKCANAEMVLLKGKSELIRILPIIRSDECLLVPIKVNGVNMFEHNHLFERFKVKLEIETPVSYALLSVQNDISGIEELYSHETAFEECKNWICMKLPNVRKINVESTSEAAKIASFSHSASLSNILCSKLYNQLGEINETYITEPIFGTMNYSEYIPGHLPLIISVPHGGRLIPPEIPDRERNHPSFVKSNDLKTQDIGRELANKITLHFKGMRPYLIINHLGRPIKEGAEEDSITQVAWNDYHNFMQTAIKDVEANFDHGLLIDIHGYVLLTETLSLSTSHINENPEIYSESSIRALYTRKSSSIKFANLLYGKTTSLGGHLQSHGYDTVPSHIHQHPIKDEKYFHGGYCVQKYGSRHAEHIIDAIQIELPRTLRAGNKEKRSNFISALSESIAWFLREENKILLITEYWEPPPIDKILFPIPVQLISYGDFLSSPLLSPKAKVPTSANEWCIPAICFTLGKILEEFYLEVSFDQFSRYPFIWNKEIFNENDYLDLYDNLEKVIDLSLEVH
ncbi:3104_t:CDS:2 [Gigaspora margarita]|uniref:3104_t:CDS:1 n=1 Tax=Gigaspora margarita TaxID=4874 RepID=A0ABM8W2F4_GIGMA|nr:3104_t:CDS:2 [Gigaspora margarita]